MGFLSRTPIPEGMMTNVLFDGLLRGADPARRFAEMTDGRFYSYQDVLDGGLIFQLLEK